MSGENTVEFGARSEVGLVRRRNEDAFLVDEDRRVFVVADGLGGHPAGDVASRVAVEAIRATLRQSPDGDSGDALHDALLVAHRALLDAAEGDRSLEGMGTTAVLAQVSPDDKQLFVAHVGDSRAYLLRSGELRQLTDDHRDRGPYGGGRITQALGTRGRIRPSVVDVELDKGDRVLLCTDGLTDMVDDAGIRSVLDSSRAPEGICDDLVGEALAHGGVDNITVVVVDV